MPWNIAGILHQNNSSDRCLAQMAIAMRAEASWILICSMEISRLFLPFRRLIFRR
jgi:hypothetical protein